ncbi:hypothetical protein JW935_23055 [candidate division KSB1 bacterium]|nr:hypothetical protein [candidate division KSB1 bacterium]
MKNQLKRKQIATSLAIMLFFCSVFIQACCYNKSKVEAPVKVKKADVLGQVTFDQHNPGEKYGMGDVEEDFGAKVSWGTMWPYNRLSIVEADSIHGKVLQVNYPKNKVRFFASGGSWKWKKFPKSKELYLSYWVKFPDDFVFRHGGKLHGLVGGKGNSGGHKPNGHDGWSCRMHWGPENQIKLYIYHKDQQTTWGDVFYFNHKSQPIVVGVDKLVSETNPDNVRIQTGKWHYIMLRVKMNDIGAKNGVAQAWYDGELVADIRGLEWRDSTCKDEDLLVSGMYFSTFFGGRDDRYRPVKDEYLWFDDFTVSEQFNCPQGMECEPVPSE